MTSTTDPAGRGRLRFTETRTRPLRPSDTDEDTRTLHIAPGAAAVRMPLHERFVDPELIGHGGMGTVYSVKERSLFREVAMKVLRDQGDGASRARLRFIEEAQINGQLEHPNIVPVYELGQDDDGVCFFTMKRVEGRTLEQFLKQENVPENRDALYEVLQIFLRVCDALAFAHSRGVMHRDVKPSNIMVGDHGQVYLMDWGIALVLGQTSESATSLVEVDPDAHDTAAEGTIVGTVQYMSPEQASGLVAEVDARSDVFSLGAVLYRALTGRAPYSSQTPELTLEHAQTGTFPAVDPDTEQAHLPPGLSRIAAKAMAYERADRFQTVDQMKDELEEVLRGRWRFPTIEFACGETILREGEHGNEAYIIRSGHCRVFRINHGERQVLRDIGPGEVFGETAVFTKQPRNAFVEALDDVVCWVVSGEILTEELGLDSWRGAFVRTLGHRFSERSERVAKLERHLQVERCRSSAMRAIAQAGGAMPLVALRKQLVDEGGLASSSFDEALADDGWFLVDTAEQTPTVRLAD